MKNNNIILIHFNNEIILNNIYTTVLINSNILIINIVFHYYEFKVQNKS